MKDLTEDLDDLTENLGGVVIHDDEIYQAYVNHIKSAKEGDELLLIIEVGTEYESTQISINMAEMEEALKIMKERKLLSILESK